MAYFFKPVYQDGDDSHLGYAYGSFYQTDFSSPLGRKSNTITTAA
jgi:hypothetical protein